MSMTLSQEQAENTSPVTDVMPRKDESYPEREVQIRTKTKTERRKKQNQIKNSKGKKC